MKRKISAVLLLAMLCELLSISALARNVPKEYKEIYDGIYIFQSRLNSNKVLDIDNNNISNGTNIQLYDINGTSAQSFRVMREDENSEWFYILSTSERSKDHRAMALDVCDGKKGSKVNVQLWESNGTDAQLWKFESDGNGYYRIKNKLGYYLDVSNGKTSNKTNIWVYSKNNTNAQKWRIIQLDHWAFEGYEAYEQNGACMYIDEERSTISKSGTILYAQIKNPKGLEITDIGISLYEIGRNDRLWVTEKNEQYSKQYRYQKNGTMWYNFKKELGIELKSDTLYEAFMYACIGDHTTGFTYYFCT